MSQNQSNTPAQTPTAGAHTQPASPDDVVVMVQKARVAILTGKATIEKCFNHIMKSHPNLTEEAKEMVRVALNEGIDQ